MRCTSRWRTMVRAGRVPGPTHQAGAGLLADVAAILFAVALMVLGLARWVLRRG
ncbi:MAG: hypothetical protein WAN48_11265 [Actinomycetes bacterium]